MENSSGPMVAVVGYAVSLLVLPIFLFAFFKFDVFMGVLDFFAQKARNICGAIKERATRITKANEDDMVDFEGSRFTGSVWGWFGVRIAFALGVIFSFGVAFPWLVCYRERYIASRTLVNGRRIYFDGAGVQLIGKYIQWLLLTIITFGIYSFWLRLKIKKWVLSHTHFEGIEKGTSDFDGGLLALTGISIASNYLSLVTLGIASFWMHCWKERYMASHSVIDGQRLYFDGTGPQYFAKKIVWLLLTVVTFGVYSFWLAHRAKKWTVKHTWMHTPENIPLNVERERSLALQDAARAEEKAAKKEEERKKALERRKHPLFRKTTLWLIAASGGILAGLYNAIMGMLCLFTLIFSVIARRSAKAIDAYGLYMLASTYIAAAVVLIIRANIAEFDLGIGFEILFGAVFSLFLIVFLARAKRAYFKK